MQPYNFSPITPSTPQQASDIDTAFSLILGELAKRDEKISELEEEIRILKSQLYQQQQKNLVTLTMNDDSYRLNYNSDTDSRIKIQVPKKSVGMNSMMTYNGAQQSRNEVKMYLSEVKDKVDPKTFREFIKNIKKLTSKDVSVDRAAVIENVRALFGKKFSDLFEKFEKILCVKK